MNFELKFRLLLHKAYLDKGWGLTHYVKYAIILFGVTTADLGTTTLAGLLYMGFCYMLGRGFYTYNWIRPEAEVGNRFNLFQQEVREKLK